MVMELPYIPVIVVAVVVVVVVDHHSGPNLFLEDLENVGYVN